MPPKLSTEQRTALKTTDDHVTLPPRTSLMIPVYRQDAVYESDAIVESDQSLLLNRDVSVARGIMRLKKSKPQILVMNFTEDYQHLSKGASSGFVEEIHEESHLIAVADFQREYDDACNRARFVDVNPA